MVVLDPGRVTLGGAALTGVRSITVDRAPERLLEEWGEGGPFCVFVDAARVRVTVKVVRLVGSGETGAVVLPGEEATLAFTMSSNASGAGGLAVTATCVGVSVRHDVTGPEDRRATPGVVQTIELRAVGTDVDVDPVAFASDEGV